MEHKWYLIVHQTAHKYLSCGMTENRTIKLLLPCDDILTAQFVGELLRGSRNNNILSQPSYLLTLYIHSSFANKVNGSWVSMLFSRLKRENIKLWYCVKSCSCVARLLSCVALTATSEQSNEAEFHNNNLVSKRYPQVVSMICSHILNI